MLRRGNERGSFWGYAGMSQTNERAFETYVEKILYTQIGWQSGTNAEWDVERALFPARVFAFLKDTQPKLWAEMRALHAAGLEAC